MRYSYLLIPLLFTILASSAYASSAASGSTNALQSYLSTYIPNSIIANSTFTNITYNSDSYELMQISPNNNVLINATNAHYSIVLNNATAYSVLKDYLISEYSPSKSLINKVNSTMALYKKQANPPLADCLIETGIGNLNLIQNNTVTNNTATTACFTVPICRASFYNYSGVSGPLVQGIKSFGNQYINMNNSYRSFFSLLQSLNASDFVTNVNGMEKDISNLTTIQTTMPKNPLFPLSQNVSPSLFSSCSDYNQNDMPYYCEDIGDCEYTTFNATTLSNVSSEVSSLLALPVYNKTIMSYATNTTVNGASFVAPVIIKLNTTKFDAFMNATAPKYNSTVKNASDALSKVSNATLTSMLSKLEDTFSSIQKAGIYQNVSIANKTVNAEMSNVSKQSAFILVPYESLIANVENSTASILVHELDYKTTPPKQVALLSLQEARIDSMAGGKLNNSELNSLSLSSANVSSKASALPVPLSTPSFLKSIDGGIVSAMLYGSSSSMASKIASAPLYAALISLLIAVVLIAAFYGATYSRLHRKHKLKLTKRVKKAWMFLFIALAVIGLIYAGITYSIASSANGFLPVSSFMASASASNTVVIGINGTGISNLSNIGSSSLACAGALQSTLKAFNKSTGIIAIENDTCTVGNLTSGTSGTACYNKILGSNEPLIQINQNTNASYVSYKGFYGTVLYASGSAAQGNSCYLNDMLKQALSK